MKKKYILFLLVLLSTLTASAYDAEIGGFYYNFVTETKQAEVTGISYISDYRVIIPATVKYNGVIYNVTSIGREAFRNRYVLKSVTIPNSVTSIGSYAFSDCSGLTSMTIPNSVISIGDWAFSGCSGLTKVELYSNAIASKSYSSSSNLGTIFGSQVKEYIIGNNVTSIGSYAFEDCSGLTSVTIGNSVTSIGAGAFYDCSDLTSVTIPNSVTVIGDRAFYGCSGLTSITIPSSVTSIGDYAFSECSGLTSIIVERGNTKYDSRDNCNAIIETASNTITQGCKNTKIPNSVTSIGGRAFYGCSGLNSITIPNSVTSIGSSAFYNCSRLTSVTIPNSVTSIGSYAFSDCSGLTSVTIPNSVTSIGSSAFYNCSGLTSVTIPNSVTSIGGYAFYGCSGLTSVTIPNSVTVIGDRAFYGCSRLTSVTIPNSVTSIGESAFSYCSGLTSVHITDLAAWCKIYFSNSSSNPLSYANHLFINGKEIKDLVIPNSVTSIAKYAFYKCSGLTSVTIGSSVTSIGERAFYNCSGLKSVTIPNSVTSIGNWAFAGCSGLTSITIPNSVTSIGSSAFYNCSRLTSVTCEATSVPSTGSNVFDVLINSATLYVPSASVDAYKKTAPWSGFGTIEAIIFKYGDIYYSIMTTKQATVISGKEKYTGSVNIPETVIYNDETYSVTSIGDGAFENCSGLTSVTIPNSVTSIGNWAFSGCSRLTSVTIPNSVKSIGNGVFYNCSGLINVYCHAKNVPSTGSSVFYNVPQSSATLFVPSASVDAYKKTAPWSGFGTIGVFYDGIYYKFDKTTKKATVVSVDEKYTGIVNIPETVTYNGEAYSVTSIGSNAFNGCTGMTSIEIPNSVTSIGSYAFYGCSSLTSVHIKDLAAWCKISFSYDASNPLSYAHHLFMNGNEVKDLVIPNSVTSIGGYAFYGCSGLTSIEIPNSVTSIRWYAFSGCSGLTSVTIGSSVASIGYEAFYGCSGLTSITIPNSVTSISSSAFAGCSGLTSVTIPSSVTSIGSDAFYNCSSLTSVTCEATSVPSTGSDVFYNVPQSSATLYVPASALETYKKAYSWSSFGTIKAIIFKYDGIYYEFDKTTKQATVISGDEKYTGIVNIPANVTYNGETYSVTSIGSSAFASCSGLTSIIIPNTVKSIGARAFQYCYGLTSVTCEATSVPSTGSNVFGSVYLSRATLYVPASALETYKKTEPWSSFGTIKVLEVSGSCGDNVYYTFNYPTGVLKITGTGSMNNYNSNSAPWYSYNYYIRSVEISDGVTSIGDCAFDGCSGLTSVTIPNSVTSIGKQAFYGCSGLTSVTIPNSVTSIGGSAFNGCSGLTSITIPNSVTSIGAGAFENCSGLTSVTIPNSVTSIENWAFSGCSGLTSVTIPNSVKSIGNDVFYNCSGLINVYCHAKNVPSTGSYVFYNFPQSSATLYVPASALETYKKTAPWSSFGNILALPEPLNYYDYGLTMKTLTDKAEWANIMKSAPNAVAVAEAELEEWAASQTNVIVKKNNAYYCPNFILTDLTEIAGSGYEKTGFYSPYDFTVKKGSYRRQAYAGYNTICVPFSFTASDLSGTAKTYAFEHYDDGEGKAIFKRVKGTIAAGTPCIVKESGNVVWNINLANKKISARSSSEDSHMRGTFVSTDVYQGKGYSPNSVNEFSPLSQYLHPFRACLILGSVSGARAIRLVLDDAVTDIDEVEVDSATPKNGKYLEKGKLIIYKSGRKYNANGSTIK